MSVSQLVSRERFSIATSEVSGGIKLDVNARGRTGDIRVDVRVSAPSFLPGPEISLGEMTVRMRPTGFNSLKNAVRRVPGRASRGSGISSSFLRQTLTPDFPDPGDLIFSETIRGPSLLPEEFTFGPIRFPPIPVPDIDNLAENLPQVSITVEIVPSGIFGPVFADLPSVDLELPPEAFIATVNLERLGCGDLFSDIKSNLDRLNQRLSNASDVDRDLDTLQDVREQVLRQGRLRNLRDADSESFGGVEPSILQDWRNEVRQVDTDVIPGSDSLRDLNRLSSRLDRDIDDIGIPGCQSELRRRFNDLNTQLNRINDVTEDIRDLRSQLLDNIPTPSSVEFLPCFQRQWDGVDGNDISDALDDLEDESFGDISSARRDRILRDVNNVMDDIRRIPRDDAGGCRQEFMSRAQSIRSRVQQRVSSLDCSDVPQFVTNAVAGVEQEARSFSTAREVSRTERRFNSILGTIDDAREQVEERVDPSNPCSDNLFSRLDAAESNLRSAGAADPESLSCDSKYSSIDRRVTDFEDDVVAIQPPVDADTFELFASRADNVIQNIEEQIPSEDTRCINNFTRRVDGALDRVADVGARARTVTDLTDEQIERRREVVEELRGRIRQVAPSRAGLFRSF